MGKSVLLEYTLNLVKIANFILALKPASVILMNREEGGQYGDQTIN